MLVDFLSLDWCKHCESSSGGGETEKASGRLTFQFICGSPCLEKRWPPRPVQGWPCYLGQGGSFFPCTISTLGAPQGRGGQTQGTADNTGRVSCLWFPWRSCGRGLDHSPGCGQNKDDAQHRQSAESFLSVAQSGKASLFCLKCCNIVEWKDEGCNRLYPGEGGRISSSSVWIGS